MLLKVDHYTALARAVGRLDRDSYEARGAVYDRALAALVKRLNSVVPPYSQADIDMELLAFREAVRRVEFGDLDEQDWLAQQGEAQPELAPEDLVDEEAPAPPSIPVTPSISPADAVAAALAAPRGAQRGIQSGVQGGAQSGIQGVAAVAAPHALPREPRRRRSVLGRVVGRTLLAAVLLCIGFAGYAQSTGQVDFSAYVSPLARLMDQIPTLDWSSQGGYRLAEATVAENASYSEQAEAGAPWNQVSGQATWRVRLEPVAGGKTEPVLLVDVSVPERGLKLAISMRHDAGANAAMSHLVEMQFSGANDFPVDNISGVMGISMKNAEDKGGTSLAGLSVRVAPGVFLYGLSPDPGETRRNLELLRTRSRLDIPVAFSDGRTGIISLEKGASGERVLAQVLDQWEQ